LKSRFISLRGVEVHNLKGVDLDIPHRKLVVFCGVSGSGKTSLALDTLYAEGQRRYIDSFSPYARQFLERLEKPAAERIDGLPPAVAIAHRPATRVSRGTVGTATETADYLRLLYARIGRVACRGCGKEVRRDTPASAAESLLALPEGMRYMVGFPQPRGTGESLADWTQGLREEGFVRLVAGERLVELGQGPIAPEGGNGAFAVPAVAIVDRLAAGSTTPQRLHDSLETAFAKGGGYAVVFVADDGGSIGSARIGDAAPPAGTSCRIDGRGYRRLTFSTRLACEDCSLEYVPPEPSLFSFNSPLGACPRCEGFGNVVDIDMDLVVPEPVKSLREGAIAPFNSPAYAHELKKFLEAADELGIPADLPFRELSGEHVRILGEGLPERGFDGLAGFFARLERRKYKMHLRVFLSRWRSYRPCPTCRGTRLRPESLDARLGKLNIAEFCQLKIADAAEFLRALRLASWEEQVGRVMLRQVAARLEYLVAVGLGYLTLGRSLRTLSGGEAQRVALTSILGSGLVNMLYVLDEPSVGLHPADVHRLLESIRGLCDRGNSVVVVEHEEAMLRAADHLVEIGPGAGDNGGQIVYEGPPKKIENAAGSLTGDYLAGRRGTAVPEKRRPAAHGTIRLTGARGNNLKNITVEFPLGLLCLVTGVSGAGKSTLVQDTLHGALCRRLRKEAPKPLPFDDVFGAGQIEDVVLIDQSPIGRSPRSNPVTYVKAFDDIRAVFADTVEARMHNYTAGHFSFNVDGGRCGACEGDGYLAIDMQFLADVYMKCPQCGGQRYRKEILGVTYRGLNIAEVLEMTVREAFGFFRGQPKVQAKLKRLIDVGLEYLRLGQPANTLSAGEAQRLKLAGYLAGARRGRTLFLLDEPTTGLHFSDVVQLLDCFEALLSVGHSLIVVEHNLQMMQAADYIIDLGPGAADEGGRVVAKGTPEAVAADTKSVTGRQLAERLRRSAGG
jgi:excinuclease ABC subunit A